MLGAVALVLCSLQGCATYGSLTAVPSRGERSVFQDGQNTIISTQLNTVAVTPRSNRIKSGDQGAFVIAVHNGLTNDLVFSTENVSASDTVNGRVEALHVYTYDQLVAQEKRRQAWAAFAVALAGATDSINAANAGYSHTYGTYSGSAYASNGVSAYGYGNYSSTTYNYAAAQAAQNVANANTSARFAALAEQGQENLRALSSAILKKQTVFPGTWYGGVVMVSLPSVTSTRQQVRLDVEVGGEHHEFLYNLEKASN